MNDERPVKSVSDSRTEQVHLLLPRSMNHKGRLFGGEMLRWIDEIAGIVSMRHSGRTCVTASIERMDFKAGAKNGDVVYICGYLTYVGNSSMEVRVDTFVESLSGERKSINTAYVVMIAIDKDTEQPIRVPRYIPQDVRARVEWENGRKRQELRSRRRLEGY